MKGLCWPRICPGRCQFITSIFDDIGAYEKNRDALWANPAFLDHQVKLTPLLRQPTEITLSESIVNTMAATGATQPRYAHRALVYPATGAEPEVRSILEGFAKGQQADGRPYFRMGRRLFSAIGPVFTMRDSYWAQEGTLKDVRTLIRRVSNMLPDDPDVSEFARLVTMAMEIEEENLS